MGRFVGASVEAIRPFHIRMRDWGRIDDDSFATEEKRFIVPDPPKDCRAGMWCGGADCPRVILTAGTAGQLEQIEKRFRCPKCGKPALI